MNSAFRDDYRPRATLAPSLLLLAALVAFYTTAGTLQAADSLVYSFESALDNFVANGPITLSPESTIGVTHGETSMRVDVLAGFVGARTADNTLNPLIGDPPGLDHVTFDLTLTQEYTGTFAVVGVMVFGVNQQGDPVQIQTGPDFDVEAAPVHEYHLEDLAPGTYEVTIDMYELFHPVTEAFTTFNDIVGTQGSGPNDMIPTSFQLYFNKNASSAFPLTVYIDNVRVGMTPAPSQGDYNQDGAVDAADYVIWRKAAGLGTADLPNDNDDAGPVGAAEYALWRTNFGSGAAGGGSKGGVPEPASAALLTLAAICGWGASRKRGTR